MSTPKSPRVPLVLLAFLLSGAAALIYEVAWTRALALVLGSTTYAVSTMLATFMAGLALGAWLGGRFADRKPEPIYYFGLCELGIGLSGLVSLPLIYALPRYYLALYSSLHLHPTLFFIAQIALCAVVMAIPTTLMGATFPLVSRAITRSVDEVGVRVGRAYSFNTIGAVFGSLVAGFFLVPRLGLKGAVLTAGVVNLVVGAVMVASSRRGRSAAVVVLALLYLPAGAWALSATRTPSLFSFYSAHRYLAPHASSELLAASREGLELLFKGSYVEGDVSAFRDSTGHLLLQVGGKIEGTGPRDVQNTLLLAYLPIAAHPEPRSMLVVGLGAGVTLAAAKEHLATVDLVEIHPGVLEAVSRFGPPGTLDGVTVFQNDARNFLLRTDRRWDLISSEPSYPTESVVANLFTREYFELAATRLESGGIYCQWLPYHMLTNDDITMMIKTFGSVFPHAQLWKIPNGLDLLLLGSREALPEPEAIQESVARLNRTGEAFDYVLSRRSEEIAAIVARPNVPVNTDDRPILEFRASRNLLIGDLALLEATDGPDDPERPIRGDRP